MKKITDVMSPLSWMMVNLTAFCGWIALFHPSLLEFFYAILVDVVALSSTFRLEQKLFLKIYPKSKWFFPVMDWTKIRETSSAEGKAEMLAELFRFPRQRSLFVFVFSAVKVLPCNLVMTFLWAHTNSNTSQFILAYLSSFVLTCFIAGACFLEGHRFISSEVRKLQEQVDLSPAFRVIQITETWKYFIGFGSVTSALILASMVVLQVVILKTFGADLTRNVPLLLVVIATGAIALVIRLWYVGLHYFFTCMQEVSAFFEGYEPASTPGFLPLHSAPMLARFEKVINEMAERIRTYDHELSIWVVRKTEEMRYQSLGETSALVAHDLAAPLHVIRFCVDAMRGNPAMVGKPEFTDQMEINLRRAEELLNLIRASLKDASVSATTHPGSYSASISEAYQYAMQLVRMRYKSQGIDNVEFWFDPALADVYVMLTRTDLIHIFFNLIANSVSNLLEIKPAFPRIEIRLQYPTKSNLQNVTLRITDNGSGLKPERFEELTGSSLGRLGVATAGLGLRLIRRLIEKYQGSIAVEIPEQGTSLRLELPVRQWDEERVVYPEKDHSHQTSKEAPLYS